MRKLRYITRFYLSYWRSYSAIIELTLELLFFEIVSDVFFSLCEIIDTQVSLYIYVSEWLF